MIGSTAAGLICLAAPVNALVMNRWPGFRRPAVVIGFVIVVTSLVAASFSTKVWHLIMTQSILFAVGGNLMYFPSMDFLDGWFIKRKGLAFGVTWVSICQPPTLIAFDVRQAC